jgi:hypothetical protein
MRTVRETSGKGSTVSRLGKGWVGPRARGNRKRKFDTVKRDNGRLLEQTYLHESQMIREPSLNCLPEFC